MENKTVQDAYERLRKFRQGWLHEASQEYLLTMKSELPLLMNTLNAALSNFEQKPKPIERMVRVLSIVHKVE